MSHMTIDVQHTDEGDALLFLAGEVDLSHVDLLWSTALRSLETPPSRLVVDLSGITFLDSSILGTLVRIQRAAQERGKDFTLRRPAPLVRRVLRLTGLDGRITVED